MRGILLSKSPRDKRINEVAGVSAESTVKVACQAPRNAINSMSPRLRRSHNMQRFILSKTC